MLEPVSELVAAHCQAVDGTDEVANQLVIRPSAYADSDRSRQQPQPAISARCC
jgi:hypothetical protein